MTSALRASDLRARIGRRLEQGAPILRVVSAAWTAASARRVARPLRIPEGVRVIGIGGAVLGGAGKTPLAIELARALSIAYGPVALVGHAYRARPGRARVVTPDDALADVGDDALAAARLLAGSGAEVLVAPSRQVAVDLAAARGHRVVIVDGLLQTSPSRLDAAILVLDAAAPWGSGACPPAGDLRAPRDALLAAADLVAAVHHDGVEPSLALPPGALRIDGRLDGALSFDGRRIPLADLAGRPLGLLLTIARPGRVSSALARHGIHPVETLVLGDHGVPAWRLLDRAARLPVAGWLTTPRCVAKLPARLGASPVLVLDHRLDVGPLAAALVARVVRNLPALC